MTIITKKTPLHIPSMDTFLSDKKFFEITIPPRINLQAYRDDDIMKNYTRNRLH